MLGRAQPITQSDIMGAVILFAQGRENTKAVRAFVAHMRRFKYEAAKFDIDSTAFTWSLIRAEGEPLKYKVRQKEKLEDGSVKVRVIEKEVKHRTPISRSKYAVPKQGAREKARRVRQSSKGTKT